VVGVPEAHKSTSARCGVAHAQATAQRKASLRIVAEATGAAM